LILRFQLEQSRVHFGQLLLELTDLRVLDSSALILSGHFLLLRLHCSQ
jgi:hypothetical protein